MSNHLLNPPIAAANSVKWRDWFSNLPLVMLAGPASYGVASFESGVYPAPVNWVMAAAFESVYLGAIFLAQNKSKRMFTITITIAVLCGIVYNFLHPANIDGLLAHSEMWVRWLLAGIHGAPLSLISLCYALLLHKTSDAHVLDDPTDALTPEYFQSELRRVVEESGADRENAARTYQNQLSGLQEQLDALAQEWERKLLTAPVPSPAFSLAELMPSLPLTVTPEPTAYEMQAEAGTVTKLLTRVEQAEIKSRFERGQLSLTQVLEMGVSKGTAKRWAWSRTKVEPEPQNENESEVNHNA